MKTTQEVKIGNSNCEYGYRIDAIETIPNINENIRINKSPQDIIQVFNTKEIDTDWSFIEYKPSDTGKWTHNYHRYPAKFIPQLVEKLIDEYIICSERLS